MNCGTVLGWNDHRRKNEPPCKWCRQAVEAPTPPPTPKPKPAPKPRKSRATGKGRGGTPPIRPPAKCGTPAGYQRHIRLKHPDCVVCREAANKRRKEIRDRRKATK